ncbi:MAG TPA: shikimate kinase [Patescibacteria group bacterium]|nr:shikimate kinase [Patescibacteria group bacterium]
MKNNVVLIGFMGTGKTSVGKMLAERLNRTFADVDKKIEQAEQTSISEIFRSRGETEFRRIEREMIARVSRYTNTVIATGGGVVLFPENMNRLRKNSIVIALTARPEVIVARTVRRGGRPLLDCQEPEQAVRNLLAQRAELYLQADHTIDTSEYSPQQVVESIVIFLRQGGYLRGRSSC